MGYTVSVFVLAISAALAAPTADSMLSNVYSDGYPLENDRNNFSEVCMFTYVTCIIYTSIHHNSIV